MEEKEYFIIRSSEDGLRVYGPLTKTDLLRKITPCKENEWQNDFGTKGFYHEMPENTYGSFEEREGREKLVIIHGKIVVPYEKVIVKEYDVP